MRRDLARRELDKAMHVQVIPEATAVRQTRTR